MDSLFEHYRFGADVLPRYGDPWIRAQRLMDRKPKYGNFRRTPRTRNETWIRAKRPTDPELFHQTIELTGKGDELIYDTFGARWFRSSYKAVKEANEAFIEEYDKDNYMSYCDWYYLQGISPSDLGYRYGYSPYEDWKVDLKFVLERKTKDEFNRNCDWRIRDINEDVILTGPDPECLPYELYWEY